MGLSTPSLPQLASFDPQAFIQAGVAGRRQQTLADLGALAAKGDYQGAANAAFAGGQPDLGTQMLDQNWQQHQRLVQDAGSLAMSATTPQAWAAAGAQFEKLHPGVQWAPFEQRDQVIAQTQTVGDQLDRRLKEQQLAIDSQRNAVMAAPYMAAGYTIPGFGGSGGGGDMTGAGAVPPPAQSPAPPPQPTGPQPSPLPGYMGGRFDAAFAGNTGAPAVQAAFTQRYGAQPQDNGYAGGASTTPATYPTPSATPPQSRTIFNSPVGDVIASLPDPDTPSGKLGGMSANGLKTKVDTYFTNGGNIQGLGMGSGPIQTVQRTAIMNYAGELAAKIGLTVPEMTAAYKANSSAATQITQRVARIDTTANTLAAQFPRLQQLADKLASQGVNITESDFQAGKAAILSKFGSPDAAAYYDLLQTVRGDYAAMQAAIAGGRGGLGYVENAKEAIPVGRTGAQYAAIGNQIGMSAANARQASGEQIHNLIYGSTNPDAAAGGGAPRAGGPQPGMVEDGFRFKGGDPSVQANWEPVG